MEERMTDRIPPHHMDAERSVLGSMLLAHEAVLLAQELLDPEDFYDGHKEIFAAMCHLANQSRKIDLVTVDRSSPAADASRAWVG